MLHLALAAAATLLSAAFGMCTFERWLDRRKPHEAAWSAALGLFALASASLWAGAAFGWNDLWFRLFYLFGAIVNVPYLALGTVYLLADRRTAHRAAIGVHAFTAFSAGVVAVAPLRAIDPAHLPQGSDVFGPLPRILAAAGSGVAAVVIVVGAVVSAARFARRRSTRRLALGNALIAAGTLVLGAGGVLNSVLDEMDGFAISLVAGITLVFAGFLVASAPRARTMRVVEAA